MFRTPKSTQKYIPVLILSFVVLFLSSVAVYFIFFWLPFRFGQRNAQVFIEPVSSMSASTGTGKDVDMEKGRLFLTENDIHLENISGSISSSVRNEGSPIHRRLLLLGDSTLDNSYYVPPEKSVYSAVRQLSLGKDYNPVMYARDGFTIADVYLQVGTIPIEYNVEDNCIVLSVGGNDFLSGSSYNESIVKYRHLIERIRGMFDACKLYLVNLYQPVDPSLSLFRVVVNQWNLFLRGLVGDGVDGIIDIHGLLETSEDFVHKIEPSIVGGKKIAEAIIGAVG